MQKLKDEALNEDGKSKKDKKKKAGDVSVSTVSSVTEEDSSSDSGPAKPQQAWEEEVRWEDTQRNRTKKEILAQLKLEQKTKDKIKAKKLKLK